MRELFSSKQLDLEAIAPILQERSTWLERKQETQYREALDSAPKFQAKNISLDQDFVGIGRKDEITPKEFELLEESAKKLIPWKKGPFSVFGLDIDGEWRSDFKWNRLKEELPPLKNKRILDIGCNNGYFMFRMLAENPSFVLGIDPVVRTMAQFQWLQSYLQSPKLFYELLGVEHLKHFHQAFDIIFSMGIIYHHQHPLEQLAHIREALLPNGHCILETIGIPGDESVALFPPDRYAKMRNVWFVPTLSCLQNWAKRSKFSSVKVLHSVPLTTEEQRATDWCHPEAESLIDFLDPSDSSLTVEGHPAPWRMTLLLQRGP